MTPSGSESNAKSTCSGSIVWWLLATACSLAASRAACDLNVSLFRSMSISFSSRGRSCPADSALRRSGARSRRDHAALPRQGDERPQRHDVERCGGRPERNGPPATDPTKLRLELGRAAAELLELGLHLHDQLHAGEVHPLALRQLLDHLQARDVPLRVAPGVPRRALGPEQALALVDAERLRVHARELGRDADDVDGAILRSLRSSALPLHLVLLTSRSRGARAGTPPRPPAAA